MNTQYDRLLVVDDEEDIADYLCTVGQGLGFSTLAVSNDNDFTHALSDFAPTVILLDLQMPGKDGIELLKVLRESHCDAQIVLVSGLDDRTIATASQFGQVLGLNITATLPKPEKGSQNGSGLIGFRLSGTPRMRFRDRCWKKGLPL